VPEFISLLEQDPQVTIFEPRPSLLQRGLQLYIERADKKWTLTDCVSFIVMGDEALTDALTGDHHFEQAGFKALLR
jgi:predicted nucleic acid-binding protein